MARIPNRTADLAICWGWGFALRLAGRSEGVFLADLQAGFSPHPGRLKNQSKEICSIIQKPVLMGGGGQWKEA